MKMLLLTLTLILANFAFAEVEIMNITNNTRVDKVGHFLILSAMNEQKQNGLEITQKELQETLRFIHIGQLTTMELLELKMAVANNEFYKQLSVDTQKDLQTIFQNIIDINIKMDEHKQEGMWCRFVLRNNPWDEVSDKSIFKNPDQYLGLMPMTLIKELKAARYQRTELSHCWKSKEQDYLYKLGIDPVTLKPMVDSKK